jgi:Mg2+ and Co2+ transporter CorA
MYWVGLILGIITYALLFVTMLVGMRVIKMPLKNHKLLGITTFSVASLHAIIIIIYILLD